MDNAEYDKLMTLLEDAYVNLDKAERILGEYDSKLSDRIYGLRAKLGNYIYSVALEQSKFG